MLGMARNTSSALSTSPACSGAPGEHAAAQAEKAGTLRLAGQVALADDAAGTHGLVGSRHPGADLLRVGGIGVELDLVGRQADMLLQDGRTLGNGHPDGLGVAGILVRREAHEDPRVALLEQVDLVELQVLGRTPGIPRCSAAARGPCRGARRSSPLGRCLRGVAPPQDAMIGLSTWATRSSSGQSVNEQLPILTMS